jgi:hypothetical protein
MNVNEVEEESMEVGDNTGQAGSCDVMGQVVTLELPGSAGDTSADQPALDSYSIWKQVDTNFGTEAISEETLETVTVEIHGEFSVPPDSVFQSKECLNEVKGLFLDNYSIDIHSINFISSECCTTICSCTTRNIFEIQFKSANSTKFPDDFDFGVGRTFTVSYPYSGLVTQ